MVAVKRKLIGKKGKHRSPLSRRRVKLLASLFTFLANQVTMTSASQPYQLPSDGLVKKSLSSLAEIHNRAVHRVAILSAGQEVQEKDPPDWDSLLSKPGTFERMRISIELARCEVEYAGLTTPAECHSSLLDAFAEPANPGHSSSQQPEVVRYCVEALSRSPQLWTSYVTASRDFESQCQRLQQAQWADQARDIWKAAMEEHAYLAQSMQSAMSAWNAAYATQVQEFNHLATQVQSQLTSWLEEQTESLRQSQDAITESHISVRTATQNIQHELARVSQETSNQVRAGIELAFAQQMDVTRAHLLDMFTSAKATFDTEITDLVQPVQSDVRALSTEVQELRMKAIDIGIDLVTTRHELRDLTTSILALQASTNYIGTDLSAVQEQAAAARLSSMNATQSMLELEGLMRNSTSTAVSMLDQTLGTRAVVLERVVRAAMLYAPDVVKSVLLPLVSLSFRHFVSATAVSIVAGGNAVLGILGWAVKKLYRWYSRDFSIRLKERMALPVTTSSTWRAVHCIMDSHRCISSSPASVPALTVAVEKKRTASGQLASTKAKAQPPTPSSRWSSSSMVTVEEPKGTEAAHRSSPLPWKERSSSSIGSFCSMREESLGETPPSYAFEPPGWDDILNWRAQVPSPYHPQSEDEDAPEA